MAGYRKLGRTSSQRKALIRGQVTSLLNNGKIVTTETRAKEIRKVAEGLIALAVKEKDNFDEVEVTAKVARLDKDAKKVDLTNKLFDEIAPKYADRNGGYTRIVKIGQRKGDAAMEVLLELI